jgi:outer membrane protein OmpA-like peptidoglycan-associated protein
MRLSLLAFPTSVALFTLLTASPASAQVTGENRGFALNRFDPSERGSEWFVLDTLDLRGKARPALGAVFDWGYKPLVIYDAAGNEQTSVVEHQMFLHVGGSLVLADRFRVGLNLPLGIYQTGDDGVSNGIRYKAPESALGDLRVSGDVRLLGKYGDAFNSAVGVALYFPTGDRDAFTSDGNTRFQPRAMVSGDIGMFAYGAKVGFNYRPLTEDFGGKHIGSELVAALSAGVRVANKKLLVGPELYGNWITTPGSFAVKRTSPIEGLIGAHYTAGDFRVGAGLGTGLSRGWGTPEVRTLLSFEWAPAVVEDTDGDGILDTDDACPTVRGIRTNDPKTNGCPPPPPPPAPSDRDGDGVLDNEDACVDVPGVRTNDPKTNGCPSDRDHDGVYDQVDACPDVPGVKTDDPKTNGCPPDKDLDGIPDSEDACPDVPGVKTDDPKTNGCPPDRDKDSILDPDDACPDQPGPKDPDPKKNGCPAARIEAGQIKIIQQVKFKTGSAEILKESDDILNAVTQILKDHPEIKKIRVEGHTDNKGTAAYNKDLSKRRAASVAKWLVDHGVEKPRISSQGFGLERPIDSNTTDEGRQNNRRVEFHIEGSVDAPGSTPGGAPAPKK